jgi:hypothetical protein
VALLVVRAAERRCRLKRTKALDLTNLPRLVTLLNPSMILFQEIIEIPVRPVRYLAAQYSAYRTRIRVVPVGRYSGRFVADYFFDPLEETLGCVHVSLLREHRIEQITVSVYRSIQIAPLAPFATDFDIRFYVSSTYHEWPAFPLRLARSCWVIIGAKRASQSLTAS